MENAAAEKPLVVVVREEGEAGEEMTAMQVEAANLQARQGNRGRGV